MPEGAEGCAENEPFSNTTTSLYDGPAVTTRIEAARQGPNEPTESQPSEKEYRIQRDPAGAEAYLDAGARPNRRPNEYAPAGARPYRRRRPRL